MNITKSIEIYLPRLVVSIKRKNLHTMIRFRVFSRIRRFSKTLRSKKTWFFLVKLPSMAWQAPVLHRRLKGHWVKSSCGIVYIDIIMTGNKICSTREWSAKTDAEKAARLLQNWWKKTKACRDQTHREVLEKIAAEIAAGDSDECE